MSIDVAISGDRNVIKKEAEKIPRYEDLTVEIQRMWSVKTNVIPVITGATETISKSFRKYLNNTLGKHEIKELQKTAILGTALIDNSAICTMNSNCRIAATLYSLGTWFVSGM
jgi:hypothetical protein